MKTNNCQFCKNLETIANQIFKAGGPLVLSGFLSVQGFHALNGNGVVSEGIVSKIFPKAAVNESDNPKAEGEYFPALTGFLASNTSSTTTLITENFIPNIQIYAWHESEINEIQTPKIPNSAFENLLNKGGSTFISRQ